MLLGGLDYALHCVSRHFHFIFAACFCEGHSGMSGNIFQEWLHSRRFAIESFHVKFKDLISVCLYMAPLKLTRKLEANS